MDPLKVLKHGECQWQRDRGLLSRENLPRRLAERYRRASVRSAATEGEAAQIEVTKAIRPSPPG